MLLKADRLRAWRGRQPDQEGVEVLHDLPPDVVDRPVALVDDDEVEGLDGKVGRVLHRHGFPAAQPARLEQGLLLVLRVVLRLALQDGVEPLDGRHDDLARRVDRVSLQALNNKLLGERIARRRIPELLELVQRLTSEVVAVDEKQDAFRLRVLDQPVARRDGRERLAAAGRHLDEGARPAVREGPLQVPDCLELHRPEAALLEFRQSAEHASQLLGFVALEAKQLLRTVKREDLAAPRVRVETVGELGHFAGRFVGERKRALPGGDPLVQSFGVLPGLESDALERVARRLGFDDADGPPLDVEEVVGEAALRFAVLLPLERVLPDGHAGACVDVHVAVVLNGPARRHELAVDLLAGALFRGQGHLSGPGSTSNRVLDTSARQASPWSALSVQETKERRNGTARRHPISRRAALRACRNRPTVQPIRRRTARFS